MRPNAFRLPDNSLFPDDALKPDLDALNKAKARQDRSYRRLDKWITAAIAELSDTAKPAHPSRSSSARIRGGDIGKP
jgi:hypothetical protein